MKLVDMDINEYKAMMSKEYNEDFISKLMAELKPCGCGSDDLWIYIDWDIFPDGDVAGYVVECMACEIKTRKTENPITAQAIWNATFRNNSSVLQEIKELKKRMENLEKKTELKLIQKKRKMAKE